MGKCLGSRESKGMIRLKDARYLSPETIRNLNYSLESDVYAFGMILADLFQRFPPNNTPRSPKKSNDRVIEEALAGVQPDISSVKCPFALTLIRLSICTDPSERKSFPEISDAIESKLSSSADSLKCTLI